MACQDDEQRNHQSPQHHISNQISNGQAEGVLFLRPVERVDHFYAAPSRLNFQVLKQNLWLVLS